MTGWKTWCGVISAVLGGIGLVAHGLAADPINMTEVIAGWVGFSSAFGFLGIAHKIEKAADKIAAVTAGEPVVVATESVATKKTDVGAAETIVQK